MSEITAERCEQLAAKCDRASESPVAEFTSDFTDMARALRNLAAGIREADRCKFRFQYDDALSDCYGSMLRKLTGEATP